MVSVGGKIILNGILVSMTEPPLVDMWSFNPAKGEIDSCCGKMERQTCMNLCLRNVFMFVCLFIYLFC